MRLRGEHELGYANQFARNKRKRILEDALHMGWNSNEKGTKLNQIINTIFVNDFFLNNTIDN